MTSKIGAIFGKDHAQKKSKVLQRSLRAQEDAALQLAFYWRFPQWSNCDPADLVLTHSIGFCSVPFRWTEPLYRQ
ncbi:hypothetical protein NKJ09_16425 [Mesorhizobium sp. M0189]|uniref:hypothetical protein n=1 Tax=unclassified Mesorhizobium TaxID=325217 RepID=UPI00333DC752